MNSRRLFFTIVVSLCLASVPAAGQSSSVRHLTLDDAINLALEMNPDLEASRLEVEYADARVQEAWGYALPVLDLSGRYARALKKPVFFLPDFANPGSGIIRPIEIGANHAIDVGFNARQTLFNATVFIGVGAAHVYSKAAREMFIAKKLETITNVRRAFYGYLMVAEVREMMRENLRNSEENLRNARLLATQGIVSEYDELRATVGYENLRPMVLEAENNSQLAKDGLRMAIGLDPTIDFVVNGSLLFAKYPDDLLEIAAARMLEMNPSLRAMRLQIDVNRAFMNAERSNYLPTLTAFGNYQYQISKNDLRFSPNDFVSSSQVGLTLSMNIFQGLQTNARVQQAKVVMMKTEEQVEKLETNLRTAVHSSTLKLRQTQQRIEAQGKTVEQAQRGYRIASTRFASGSGTQLEVNDAQLALTQAQVNRIQAVFDYLIASAELDQLLGRTPDYVDTNNK